MGRRLTLVVPSLTFGGAEHVVAQMANHWATRGEDVTVVTLSATRCDTYRLAPSVKRIALDLQIESRGSIQAIANNLVRVRKLRAAIDRSDHQVVISFTDQMNVLTLLACRPLNVDTVISERIDPSQQAIGRAWSFLRRRTYPSARALVVQTERVRQQMIPVMRGRPIYVIPNPVQAPSNEAEKRQRRDSAASPRQIVAMGRLAPQKGFDLLIEAFARISERFPQWSLTILGEGPQRRALEELVVQRGLKDRVRLPGWEPEPIAVLRQSELFVLSSRFEGFPNALLEAMAAGLAVISFDCPSGPAEIIRDGIDGVLVPPEDVAALANAIERVMADEPLRRRLATEAVHVIDRFSVDRYYARWDAVLQGAPPEHQA
jgi:GalNAc-alpha-(1->4)-GalNAc-alpha-(1->3)-diNAcBac-PP-undecaprenol alpha-1,4-N-acetyl-D-galactosaminyltransferase